MSFLVPTLHSSLFQTRQKTHLHLVLWHQTWTCRTTFTLQICSRQDSQYTDPAGVVPRPMIVRHQTQIHLHYKQVLLLAWLTRLSFTLSQLKAVIVA